MAVLTPEDLLEQIVAACARATAFDLDSDAPAHS